MFIWIIFYLSLTVNIILKFSLKIRPTLLRFYFTNKLAEKLKNLIKICYKTYFMYKNCRKKSIIKE